MVAALSVSTASDRARKAARARWGEPRVLRLDQLSADERRLVQALIGAKRAADEAKAREVADDAA